MIAACIAIALAAAFTAIAARLELAIERRRVEDLREKLNALEEVIDG